MVAAAAALALVLWLFWPAAEPTPPPAAKSASKPGAAVLQPIALRRRPPPPLPRNDLPPRDALLAAVRERAPSLKSCALPGGALARLPLRLHVASSGAMRSVDFTGDPPPPRFASCVRKTAMSWTFEKVKLTSDVELLVAVSFAPGT